MNSSYKKYKRPVARLFLRTVLQDSQHNLTVVKPAQQFGHVMQILNIIQLFWKKLFSQSAGYIKKTLLLVKVF